MGILFDPRWVEIFEKKPVRALPRSYEPRLMGYKDVREMRLEWEKVVAAADRAELLAQGAKLVATYYEECRKLRNSIGHKDSIVTPDNLQEAAVTDTFNGLSALKMRADQAKAADKPADLRGALDLYAKSKAFLCEYIYDPLLASYKAEMLRLKMKDLEDTQLGRIKGYRLEAGDRVRRLALKTTALFNADQKPICHMVCVVIDLSNGNVGEGRAGHGMGKVTLEGVFGFALPVYAANAFSTANPYNCAELAALHQLKTNHPGTLMTNVYFASMMPGGSPVIPPCANCRRWIKAQNASAAKLKEA